MLGTSTHSDWIAVLFFQNGFRLQGFGLKELPGIKATDSSKLDTSTHSIIVNAYGCYRDSGLDLGYLLTVQVEMDRRETDLMMVTDECKRTKEQLVSYKQVMEKQQEHIERLLTENFDLQRQLLPPS